MARRRVLARSAGDTAADGDDDGVLADAEDRRLKNNIRVPPPPPRETATPASRLRALLQRPGCVTMPACYDALSARLIARSGHFECAFMSGYGVAASRMGDPDVGLASLDTMADAVGRRRRV